MCNSECPNVGQDVDRPYQMVTIKEDELDFNPVSHKLFHVLGRYHEHQREDRDDYVRVLSENIEEGRNFMLGFKYSCYKRFHTQSIFISQNLLLATKGMT